MPEVIKISHGLTIGDLKYGNARPGVVEANLKPGETMEQALDELDERLNAWHRSRYPHLYQEKETLQTPSGPVTVNKYTEPSPVIDLQAIRDKEQLEDAILAANSLQSLAEIKEACGKSGLISQYMKRLNELMVKQ